MISDKAVSAIESSLDTVQPDGYANGHRLSILDRKGDICIVAAFPDEEKVRIWANWMVRDLHDLHEIKVFPLKVAIIEPEWDTEMEQQVLLEVGEEIPAWCAILLPAWCAILLPAWCVILLGEDVVTEEEYKMMQLEDEMESECSLLYYAHAKMGGAQALSRYEGW